MKANNMMAAAASTGLIQRICITLPSGLSSFTSYNFLNLSFFSWSPASLYSAMVDK